MDERGMRRSLILPLRYVLRQPAIRMRRFAFTALSKAIVMLIGMERDACSFRPGLVVT